MSPVDQYKNVILKDNEFNLNHKVEDNIHGLCLDYNNFIIYLQNKNKLYCFNYVFLDLLYVAMCVTAYQF